ncbi:MAG: hypothetical protein ACT4P1_17425 [Sporichthyaceae bacterium]
MLLDVLSNSDPIDDHRGFDEAEALDRLIGFERVIAAAQGREVREIAALAEHALATRPSGRFETEAIDHVAASVSALLHLAPRLRPTRSGSPVRWPSDYPRRSIRCAREASLSHPQRHCCPRPRT